MDVAPHRLVERYEEKLEPLETEFHDAYWQSQINATPESNRRRTEAEIRLRSFKGDRELYEAVLEALDSPIHEPVLLRQLQLMRSSLTGNQMADEHRERMVELDTAIENDFSGHRPNVDGRRLSDHEIEEILRTSDDSELRRKAWEGSKEVGAMVANRVKELVRLRNIAALELGYGDHFQMALDLQELPEDWLFDTLDELDRLTAEPYRRWKDGLDSSLRERFGVDRVHPWHYSDPFFQTLPTDGRISLDPFFAKTSAIDLAKETFARWGIDIRRVIELSDLFPREKKSQHAFCIDIDRSTRDVRILANVVPGERSTEVMLHESGHAAYDISIDRSLPYLLRRAAHTFVTEAMALLSGRLIRDPQWLTDIGGAPGDEVAEVAPALQRATAAQNLLFVRWVLVVTNFERQLYRDPETDLDAVWWDLVERYQLIERPPGRRAPDWAAKIHISTAPAYYQNYLLGDLLASQLRHTIEQECGELVGEKAGTFLRERFFKPGASMRWDALIEHATGRPLSPGLFVEEVART